MADWVAVVPVKVTIDDPLKAQAGAEKTRCTLWMAVFFFIFF
jgi:hypothetical protein